MTYIAYTYQMSAPSHMSTDVNKHLQTAEQTVIREGANRTEDFLAVLLGLSASTSSQRQVYNLAMARSQGLWRLDERASPKGVNGNVLNLKHQPLCQNHRGRGGNRHLHEREATVVCPDWEGHGGDSISYSLRWYLEDRGQGCQSSQGSEVGDGGGYVSARGRQGESWWCCLSLLLTWTTVTLFGQLTVCSHWSQTVNNTWHSRSHLRQKFCLPNVWSSSQTNKGLDPLNICSGDETE